MKNRYGDPAYAKTIADLKTRLERTRAELGETDEKYPKIQEIIDRHWNEQAAIPRGPRFLDASTGEGPGMLQPTSARSALNPRSGCNPRGLCPSAVLENLT